MDAMLQVPDFERVRILCVGDVMLDRFVQGDVLRISPESPVPILRTTEVRGVPGGAANVGRNIAALGGRCTLIGTVGDDAAGAELGGLLSTCGRIEAALAVDDSRPTVEKVRFVAGGQHLLRADTEQPGEITPEVSREIVARIETHLAGHDVLILSDYAKGVLTDTVVARAIDLARKAGLPVVVDPKSARLVRYAGATVITPNVKEAAGATGIEVLSDEAAERACSEMLAQARVSATLLTRSDKGMTLVTATGSVAHLPASAREVFDVVGAGDTVVATLALCLGAGLELDAAARLANVAAGAVVGKRGTATLSRAELMDEVARFGRNVRSDTDAKRISVVDAVALRREWHLSGLSVGFTNGCFDILHIGHLQLLEFARAQCDRLIVGLNADASVSRLKGPSRPINEEEDRARMLCAFGVVDAVIVFEDDTPYALIEQILPDVLVKGADYEPDQIVGHDVVRRNGGRVVMCDLVPGRSTSNIIACAGKFTENVV